MAVVTGGPISDYRITAANEHSVTFLAREGTRVGGERKQVPITLSLRQFLQRWCLHILPEQLTKTRYFGGWANNAREAYMARCRAALQQLGRLDLDEPVEPTEPTTEKTSDIPNDMAPFSLGSVESVSMENTSGKSRSFAAAVTCSHCGSDAVVLVSARPKPSWQEVFWWERETCPKWYADLQRQEHRIYWTTKYGVDLDDCDQHWWVESAEEPERAPPPPPLTEKQLLLPGLTLETAYETISF